MKKLLYLLLALIVIKGNAQSCNPYFTLKEGVKYTYEFSNAKGKVTSRHVSRFSNVTSTANSAKGTLVTDMIDVKKNTVISSASAEWRCEAGVVHFMMNNMMMEGVDMANPAITVDVSGDEMEVPSSLDEGQELKDLDYRVVVKMADIKLFDRNIHVYQRKVESKENITTPAGTFDCVRVRYFTDMAKTGSDKKSTMETVVWYAKDAGMVKLEDMKEGKVQNTQLLVKVE